MNQPPRYFHSGKLATKSGGKRPECFLDRASDPKTPIERHTNKIPDFCIYHHRWHNGQIPLAIAEDLYRKEIWCSFDILKKFPELDIVDCRNYERATAAQYSLQKALQYTSKMVGPTTLDEKRRDIIMAMFFGAWLGWWVILLIKFLYGIAQSLFSGLLEAVTR